MRMLGVWVKANSIGSQSTIQILETILNSIFLFYAIQIDSKQNEKPKEKKPRKAKPVKFPVDARINDYGFLNFRKPLLEALGWHKGMSVKIGKNPDDSITVRKV